jgi:hypothetical protein
MLVSTAGGGKTHDLLVSKSISGLIAGLKTLRRRLQPGLRFATYACADCVGDAL